MAMSLGGKRGSATAAGLIDGAGYVGATASGWGVAAIASHFEWKGVFLSLAGVCCLTLVIALAYLILSERRDGISRFGNRLSQIRSRKSDDFRSS